MKLKDAIYDKCGECGCIKGTSQEESFGCDGCKKPIDDRLNNRDSQNRHYLEVRVFSNDDSETKHLQFCSWKCVLKTLPKINTDYFITLPYLTFDNPLEKGIRAQDFFREIKKVRTEPRGR
jgi:hypothetical protein